MGVARLGLKDGYDTQRFMWEDKRASPLKPSGLVTGASSSCTEMLQLGSSQTNPCRQEADRSSNWTAATQEH